MRTALQEGWDAGEGIPDLARRVRQVFDDADRFRAAMITRTETTDTANMAQLSVYRRAGIQYKTWVTAGEERVCPICGGVDGRTVGWAEVRAKHAESYMASAKSTVADAERIFVLDHNGDLEFAFATGVAAFNWQVSVASTSLGGLVTHYGPYSGVPLGFDTMIRYRADNVWVEVTGVTNGG